MSEIVEKIARVLDEDAWCRGSEEDPVMKARRSESMDAARDALRLAAEHFAEMAEEHALTQRRLGLDYSSNEFEHFAHSIRTSVEG